MDKEYEDFSVIRNWLKSKAGAALLTFVALLQPIESFSATVTCAIKSPPLCLDATPCKTLPDPLYPSTTRTIEVCLSQFAKQGAMTVPNSCWSYKSVYDCLDPSVTTTYNDTCAPIKANTTACPDYQEKSRVCNEALINGACPSYNVTYSCRVGSDQTYTTQNCGINLCVGGACENIPNEQSASLAQVVAASEAARQAGQYADRTDPNSTYIFSGKVSECKQNTLGLGDCCVADQKGLSYSNTKIVEELIKMGWNSGIGSWAGSSYVYDTLYGSLSDGLSAIWDAVSRVYQGGDWFITHDNPPAPNSGTSTYGLSTVGGYVGGQVGSIAASRWASQAGGNRNYTAAAAATGNMIGSATGSAAVTWAFGGSFSSTFAAALGPVAIAVLVATIIASLVSCDQQDVMTQLRLGTGTCHHIGSYCKTYDQITGTCLTRAQGYCCFNSKLARIIQEQSRLPNQLNKTWGIPDNPQCQGISLTELPRLNFATMDLSEFAADVQNKAVPNQADLAASIQERVRAFFASNSANPQGTNGLILPPIAGSAVPNTIPVIPDATPTAPLKACTANVTKNTISQNGDVAGVITLSNCNENAHILWKYSGTCPAIQTYPSLADIPAADFGTVDANGNASYNKTVPASCLTNGTPSTLNQWKAFITDPASSSIIGIVTVPW